MAIHVNPGYVPENNEPSLEDMIRKLYEGNFTTGELERQLIAKLFEQCCGGGGSGSSGGAFVVNVSLSEDTFTMDKTAKEIWEAAQSSTILVKLPPLNGYDSTTIVRNAQKRIDTLQGNLRGSIEDGGTSDDTSKYLFDADGPIFVANADDEYPYYHQPA